MKRYGHSVWLIFGALAITAAVILAFAYLGGSTAESKWSDRELSNWLDTDKARADAIRATGTNGVPFLMKRLTAEDPAASRILAKMRAVFHLRARFGSIGRQRTAAVGAFRILGTNAAGALPALSDLLKSRVAARNRDVAVATAQAMAAAGVKAKPLLAGCLSNSVPNVRLAAVTALTVDFGREASDMVPCVMQRLQDSDAEIRELSLYFVCHFSSDEEIKSNCLRVALKDPDPSVRSLASREKWNY